MCGIVCYSGKNQSVNIILEGLSFLEYRGYDSAGISVISDAKLFTQKRKGRLQNLIDSLKSNQCKSTIGIGHIRWATHGEPSDTNSHPHLSADEKIAVVHNGIIENYASLKEMLENKGIEFYSQTDTEVIAKLIGYYYKGDLLKAVTKATHELQGAYALGIISEAEPDRLIAVRHESPLIMGVSKDGISLASDIPSVLKHTKDIVYLENNDIVDINGLNYAIYHHDKIVERPIETTTLTIEDATKEGYDHFMLKEIFEQPQAIQKVINYYTSDDQVSLKDSAFSIDEWQSFHRIYIVACGTAFHAGEIGKYILEKTLRIPVISQIASEFRYDSPLLDDTTLVILLSQSGETADTIAALREAKKYNSKVFSITNVVGSTIARESDRVMYCHAGPEIAVASTKAYTTQVICMYLFAIDACHKLGITTVDKSTLPLKDLFDLPERIEQVLLQKEKIEEISKTLSIHDNAFFIGRGLDFLSAKEGALKLKEISYIHTEAFPSGELKHGSIALIEKGTPVISLTTQLSLREKNISNMEELVTRGAEIYSIAVENDKEIEGLSTFFIPLPPTHPFYYPILSIIPQQLLAYYTALSKGNDVDKPRNLAKSVTVE